MRFAKLVVALCSTAVLVGIFVIAPITKQGFSSDRRISSDDAESLFGGTSSTTVYNSVCYEISSCKSDSCVGGQFTCGFHVVRVPTPMTQWHGISTCSHSGSVAGCKCTRSQLFYTCSITYAGCIWNEDEQKCEEVGGTGFFNAPQWCETNCDGQFASN